MWNFYENLVRDPFSSIQIQLKLRSCLCQLRSSVLRVTTAFFQEKLIKLSFFLTLPRSISVSWKYIVDGIVDYRLDATTVFTLSW